MMDYSDISDIVKLGEGTFGEAFKGDGCVFKIVPMDGETLVNGEVQKVRLFLFLCRVIVVQKSIFQLFGGRSCYFFLVEIGTELL